tara:strand:+ start:469 stop:678 length:210 start_codon:yes stop_codon:yes gene_type:complete
MSIKFTDWVIEQQEAADIESYKKHFKQYAKENPDAEYDEVHDYAKLQVHLEKDYYELDPESDVRSEDVN